MWKVKEITGIYRNVQISLIPYSFVSFVPLCFILLYLHNLFCVLNTNVFCAYEMKVLFFELLCLSHASLCEGRGSFKNQLQYPPLKEGSFLWISFFGTTNIIEEDVSSELT